MKIAQVIPCLGQNSGGPSRSVYNLTRGLREAGLESDIITNNYLWNPNIASEDWIKALSCPSVGRHEYNPAFRRMLHKFIEEKAYSLYHIHSIYSYPTAVASYMFRNERVPYIVAPRGSLYKSAIEVSSGWQKKLFNYLFLISDLNHASAVHVTCQEEMDAVRDLGVKSPVAIIPNAISLPTTRPEILIPDKLRICYLGRISPKKNLMGLLHAWKRAGMTQERNVELLIIGPAQTEKDKQYNEQLLKYASTQQLTNIRWMGPRNGKERDELLQTCSFLVLPSFSENFGMVVPEALKLGIPVVASKGTPWQLLEKEGCGWWTDIDDDSLAESLIRLKGVTSDERVEMGLHGQELVWKRFSMEVVSQQLISLYNWILNNNEKPRFVFEMQG